MRSQSLRPTALFIIIYIVILSGRNKLSPGLSLLVGISQARSTSSSGFAFFYFLCPPPFFEPFLPLGLLPFGFDSLLLFFSSPYIGSEPMGPAIVLPAWASGSISSRASKSCPAAESSESLRVIACVPDGTDDVPGPADPFKTDGGNELPGLTSDKSFKCCSNRKL